MQHIRIKICIKRGPLGACIKFKKQTTENDIDQPEKYFNDPDLKFKENNKATQAQAIEDEKNGLPKAGLPSYRSSIMILCLTVYSSNLNDYSNN